MNFLEKMRAQKRKELAQKKIRMPIGALLEKVHRADRSFGKSLKVSKGTVALIAEFKKNSPSKGKINNSASLKQYMPIYDKYATAISILTEEKYFGGKIEYLKEARKYTNKPLLRKDFILDSYQIYEARANGADAILLICGFIPLAKLKQLVKISSSLGMDSLVECDSESTLKDALQSGSDIIGINTRNLKTLKEDFSSFFKIAKKIPKKVRKKITLVCESGIYSARQIKELEGICDAALIGTSIMSSPVPQVKLREFAQKPLIKICGITAKKDALLAVQYGADVIGLNFYKKSPRYINVERAKEIAKAVKGKCLVCGVFVNEKITKVKKISQKIGLDMLQFSGDESAQYFKNASNDFSGSIIKAVHIKDKNSIGQINNYGNADIMLDSFSAGYGGSGKRFDTKLLDAKKLTGKNIIFSGGRNANNVAGIIKRFRPFMVDVCSGVEKFPGKKSNSKMREFCKIVEGF